MMKILRFGSYNPNYPRNQIFAKGLRENGVKIIECNDSSQILLRYLKLLGKYRSDYDAMIVCFFGHANVPLAKILTKLTTKPLIFDAFISIYDTIVFDRKLVKENSFESKFYFYLDKFSCSMADMILLDTNEQINYFHKEFGIDKRKFKRIFVGTDDAVFYPRKVTKKRDVFTVTFHGTFIPLHGIQYIVKAAKLLENQRDIEFEILGTGQTYPEIVSLSRKLNGGNVTFKKSASYEELPNFIARGDICLGIFGDTEKARRVIPNKVFEIFAMGKPLITGDSLAIKEAGIVNRKNALLVQMANPSAIAHAILELKEDEELRENIAREGYRLFKKSFTPPIIGRDLKKAITEALK